MIRKHGIRVKLQAQPFEVLIALLEKSGSVVTRDELRRRLWSENTFVDFEHGLNAAVTRLRQVLGDSAEQPRYIETLSKRGYRFIANVEYPPTEVSEAPPVSAAVTPKRELAPWIVAACLLGVAGVGATYLNSKKVRSVGRPVPLTSFPGFEANPALSPDGNHVAFTWNGEKRDNFDIYVMLLVSGRPRRLTTNAADDFSPAWSPDGQTIAFLRRVKRDEGELILIPASGGPEHKISDIRNQELLYIPTRALSITWSPDGKWVAASHRELADDTAESIFMFSRTGERRRLTTSVQEHSGDQMPAFSPDGRTLAFGRLPGYGTSEIYLLPLRANLEPNGEVHRLTAHNRWSSHPAWSRDGRRILYVFDDDPGDTRRELRIIESSGDPESALAAPVHNDFFGEISVGRHLVYSRPTRDQHIWRATIPGSSDSPAVPELFMPSTRLDGMPKYSPDGKKIAFGSSRSGSVEIWVANSDGSNPTRMTSFGGPLVGYLNWSPDGQWIVFHARPEGQADLFVIPAAGGQPRRLTTDPSDETLPNYSRDGRWIYFGSRRTGQSQIWKMPAAGGQAAQITTSGGALAMESPDGKELFYFKWTGFSENAIWKVPVEGGQPVRVIGPIHAWPCAFDITSDGIYYTAPPHSGDQRFIRFYSFSSGQSRPIALTNRPFGLGLTVTRDGRQIAFDQEDDLNSDLILIENFDLP